MFKTVNVPENSLVVRDAIDQSNADTLMCVTDHASCCSNSNDGSWYFDFGTDQEVPITGNLYMSRGNQVLRLHRLSTSTPGAEGIFWCRIRVGPGNDDFQTLYVGVYGSTDPNGDIGESVHTAGLSRDIIDE